MDYDALAAENNGTVAPTPIDYDALATQNGGEALQQSSTLGAAARGFELGVVPMATAIPGIGAGVAAGELAGGAIGGVIGSVVPVAGTAAGAAIGSTIGGFVGGMAGGFAGGMVGAEAQDLALKQLPDSFRKTLGIDQAQLQVDQEKHPYAAQIGGLAPFLFTARPWAAPGVTKAADTAIGRFMGDWRTQKAAGGAIMGAWELGQEALNKDEVDWTKVAVATAFGAVFNHQNKAGQRLMQFGEMPFEPRLTQSRALRAAAANEAGQPRSVTAGLFSDRYVEPGLFSVREMDPELFNPTLREISASGVMGPGNTEKTFQGLQERNPVADGVSRMLVEDEQSMLYGPQLPDEGQVGAFARRLDPELFDYRDELMSMADEARAAIDNYRKPSFEEYNDLRSQRSDLQSQLAETKNKNEQRRIKTQIRLLTEDIDSTWSRMSGEGQLDETLTNHYRELAAINQRLRDIGPEVSAVHRRAAEGLGRGDLIMEVKPFEEAPPVSADTPGVAPELFTAAKGAKAPSAAPTSMTQAMSASGTRVDIAAEKAKIIADRKRQMIEAGRPADEAQADAEMIANRFVARAGWFNGQLGSPYELYLAKSAKITKWEPSASPKDRNKVAAKSAAPVEQVTQDAASAQETMQIARQRAQDALGTPGQQAEGPFSPEPTQGSVESPSTLPGEAAPITPPTAEAQSGVQAEITLAPQEPAGPKVGDKITMNETPYKISEIDDKRVRLQPTKKGATEITLPRQALDQMLGEYEKAIAEPVTEGEKVTLGGQVIEGKLAEAIRKKLAEQEATPVESNPAQETNDNTEEMFKPAGMGHIKQEDIVSEHEKLKSLSDEQLLAEVRKEANGLTQRLAARPENSKIFPTTPRYHAVHREMHGRKLLQDSREYYRFVTQPQLIVDNTNLPLGKESSVKEPQSLLGFLKGLGGVKDFKGELKGADIRKRFPGLINNKNGMELDKAREAAAEAGYLGADIETAIEKSTPDDLIQKILSDEPVYSELDRDQAYEYRAQQNAKAYEDNVKSARKEIESLPGIETTHASIREEASRLMVEENLAPLDAIEEAALRVEINEDDLYSINLDQELGAIFDAEINRRTNNEADRLIREGAQVEKAQGSGEGEGSASGLEGSAPGSESKQLTQEELIPALKEIGTKEASGFIPGLSARIEKGPPITEKEIEFYNKKINDFRARSLTEGRPVTEKYDVFNVFDKKEALQFKTQLERQSGEIKDLVERGNELIKTLAKRINNAGFKVSEVNSWNAEEKPLVRKDDKLIGELAGSMSRLLQGNVNLGKGKKTAEKETRVVSDIEYFKNTLADVEKHIADTADTLYQRSGKGKQEAALGAYLKRAKEIWLKPNANPSTIIHENGHDFLEQLKEDAAHDMAPDQLRADFDTVKNWVGWKEGQADFTVKQHEKFARGFERYFYDGIAPSNELAAVFQRFSNWLRQAYQSVVGLNKPNAIPEEIRAVFDRLLTNDPSRVTVAREVERPRSVADIHETDAVTADAAQAAPMADRVQAERIRAVAELPKEIQNELAAAADRAGLGGSEAGISTRTSGFGGMAEGFGGSVTVAPSSSRSANDGAVSESRSEVTKESTGAPSGDGVGVVPRATVRFGERAGGQFVDKAGNIRLENLTTQESLKAAIREIAYGNDGFIEARRGVISDVEGLSLAEQIGMDGAENLVNDWVKGQAFNHEEIMALRLLIRESATDLFNKAEAVKNNGDWQTARDYAIAEERHIAIQKTLSGVTAEWGRAGRAFRDISGDIKVKAVEKLFRQNTGSTLYQITERANLLSALDSEQAVSRFVRNSQKTGFARWIQEYWINGLISGVSTHSTYMVANEMLALWKAIPETLTSATVSELARMRGKEVSPSERVRFGEAWAQILGAKEGFAPALKAAKGSIKTGVTTLLPGETMRTLPGLQPGQESIKPEALDAAYTLRQIMPDTFALMRSSREAIIAYGEALKNGINGETGLGLKYSPLGSIPDVTFKGVRVAPVGTILRTPGRSIQGIHAFHRVQMYFMEINAEAFRKASAELEQGIIKPEQFAQRVSELKLNPDIEMMKRASTGATEGTMMAQGGAWTRKLSALINHTVETGPFRGVQPLKFIDPFIHIASNIINESILKRTPVGLLSEELRSDLAGRNGNLAQEKAIGRMMLGTTVMIGVIGAVKEGFITGGEPSDPAEAAEWRKLHQAYSVKLGDQWYSYHRLGVLGLLMGIAADLTSVTDKLAREELTEAASALTEAFYHNIFEESFLRGPAELFRAIENHERYGPQYIRNFLSSFVPFSVGMSQWARTADPYSRRARTLTDAIKQKIPYVSQELPVRRDLWGEPIRNPTPLYIGGAVPSAIHTFQPSTDPVDIEMERVGVKKAQVDDKIRNVDLTEQQYDDFQRIAGRLTKMQLDTMVRSPKWNQLPDEVKRFRIEETFDHQREAARNLMMMKYKQIPRDAQALRMSKVMPRPSAP